MQQSIFKGVQFLTSKQDRIVLIEIFLKLTESENYIEIILL